jgi:hypothetical protein
MRQRVPKCRGPGRPPGSRNRLTRDTVAAVAQGLTPLEYLTSVYRDPSIDISYRLEAAKAAAPYVHPKLSQIEMQATTDLRNLTDDQCRAELVDLLKDPEVREFWIEAPPVMTAVSGITPTSSEDRCIR